MISSDSDERELPMSTPDIKKTAGPSHSYDDEVAAIMDDMHRDGNEVLQVNYGDRNGVQIISRNAQGKVMYLNLYDSQEIPRELWR